MASNEQEIQDLDRLVKAAEAWIAAPETQKDLQTALERVEEATAELAKARLVDQSTLHEPVTL